MLEVGTSGGVRYRRRWGAVASTVPLVLTLAACTSSPGAGGTGPPSTYAAGSPWVGTFTAAGLPSPVNSLTSVDCATASHCWAVGETVGVGGAPNGAAVVSTTDGGAQWKTQVIPPTVGYLSGVSCTSQRQCAAVGETAQTSDQGSIIATADGGATWNPVPIPPGVLDVTALTCEADGHCLAIGSTMTAEVALVSTSAGATWTQEGALPGNLSGARGVSCTDDQDCWVTARTMANLDQASGAVALTTDGGASWAALAVPSGIGILNGLSCIAGSTAGTGVVSTTTTAPGSPTAASPTTTTPTPGVAGADCVVVGTTSTSLDATRSGRGIVLTTANGGASWVAEPVTATASALMGVSCTAVGSCLAVGSSVATIPQGGLVILTGSSEQPWQRASVVPSAQPLAAVSCWSTSQCVAVGESISAYLAA